MLFKVLVTVTMLGNFSVDGKQLQAMTFEKDDFVSIEACEASVKMLVEDLTKKYEAMHLEVRFDVGKCEPAGQGI